ncbi:cyclophilin-like fold protein [Paenibacillus sp. FA6]|uniref:cyclophilin-like fold protein n=1 Tax=Paenibacillus sp. FA6 TaxID=3413029 RepID=UPI003F65ED3E
MKNIGTALITLGILSSLFFFILPFGQRELSSNMEEESQILSEDLGKKIRLEFADKEILIFLENNNSAKAFYDSLPLEFEFKDYAHTEKVTDLLEPLPKPKGDFGYDPNLGDFAYYAPWDGLVLYYKDFRYSTGIIKLGEIVEGLDNLTDMEGLVLVSKATVSGLQNKN